jgi:hypothetical protein
MLSSPRVEKWQEETKSFRYLQALVNQIAAHFADHAVYPPRFPRHLPRPPAADLS